MEDPYDQARQQQGDIRRPYTTLLIAAFAIIGGIALIVFSFNAFSSLTGTVQTAGYSAQQALQTGRAGYQPAAFTCTETNSCDECLDLLPGRICDCDRECASFRCVDSVCK